MTTQIRAWLDNAVLQSVAESYLDMIPQFGGSRSIDEVLAAGVNNLEKNPDGKGATRLTEQQITWFKANYEIVTHYPNDPSGFSATLFKNKATGAYTLSFRSTEYELQAKGGDWERDGANGADGVIKTDGMALAQLSAMETFYANLQQGKVKDANGNWVANADAQSFANDLAGGKPLNVTGYSLGAHMATSFTLLHWDEVTQAYAYNAAGAGVAGSHGETRAELARGKHPSNDEEPWEAVA